MKPTSMKGRGLAILAGAAAIGGALYILLEDAYRSQSWTTEHMLMPVFVGITIVAGHLATGAWQEGRRFAAAGLLAVFLAGTGLTVYASVGRQAEKAEATVLSATDINDRIASKKSELEKARKRLEVANTEADREMVGQRCGERCNNWKVRAREVQAHIKELEGEIKIMGSQKPVSAKADRMAQVMALFGVNQEKAKGAFVLFEPFAYALFLEMTSIVMFGYGFGHRRRVRVAANDAEPLPLTPATVPVPDLIGEQSDPVVDWCRAFEAKHGRKPQIPELQAAFNNIPKTTAWRRIKAA